MKEVRDNCNYDTTKQHNVRFVVRLFTIPISWVIMPDSPHQ
jgi:hypothetical protein